VAHDMIGVTQVCSNKVWSHTVNCSGRLSNQLLASTNTKGLQDSDSKNIIRYTLRLHELHQEVRYEANSSVPLIKHNDMKADGWR
jgi:hypothetical protein